MTPVLELNTADAIRANYKRVRGVFYPPRPVALTQVHTAPKEEAVAPVTPAKSVGSQVPLEELLANFRLAYTSEAAPRVTMQSIIELVSYTFRVSINDLKSERRTKVLVRPRQAFFFLAKELTPQSLPAIGRFMGGRDHSTACHGIRECQKRMQANPDYHLLVMGLKGKLEARA